MPGGSILSLMKRPTRMVTFVALCLMLVSSPGMSAQARPDAQNCVPDGMDPPVFHTGRGFDSSSYKVRGAKADITLRDGALCIPNPTSDTSVSTWVMVRGRDSTFRYAQIGYRQHRFFQNPNWVTVKEYFIQYINCSSLFGCYGTSNDLVDEAWGTPVAGQTHNFKVSRWNSDSHIHLLFDGSSPSCPPACDEVTPWDPLNWDNPVGQWMEESHNTGSDVPGVSANPVDFDGVRTLNDSDSWVTQNWNFSAADLGTNYCAYRTTEVDSNNEFLSFTDRNNC